MSGGSAAPKLLTFDVLLETLLKNWGARIGDVLLESEVVALRDNISHAGAIIVAAAQSAAYEVALEKIQNLERFGIDRQDPDWADMVLNPSGDYLQRQTVINAIRELRSYVPNVDPLPRGRRRDGLRTRR